MNVLKKYMVFALIMSSSFCFSTQAASEEMIVDNDGHYQERSKKFFSLSPQSVIAELHKTYDMYILVRSIADSFAASISLQRGCNDPDPILDRFDTVNNLVITGNSIVRSSHSKEEVGTIVHDVATLAEQSKPVGEVVGDIVGVVSDPHMQQAAEAVSSFALTMSKTQHEKAANQTTSSYIIETFVSVFEAAHKAGVFKEIPVVLHGIVEVGEDVADLGEAAVKKVRTTCCALF